MGKLYLGIDLGGTNIKSCVAGEDRRMLGDASVKTEAKVGVETILSNMVKAGEEACRKAGVPLADIAAIGIGTPGTVNTELGVVYGSPNLAGFNNLPLRDEIARRTGKPTFVENDANAAAFGEYWAGVAKTYKSLVFFTLGTGVGSGVVVNGHIVRGAHWAGGEMGHFIIAVDGRKCGCGQSGCLEAYASANATAARATEALRAKAEGRLAELLQKHGRVTCKDVFDAAAAGDALASRIADETERYIAVGCICAFHVTDPDVIVLGGGMTKAGQPLLDGVRKHFASLCWTIGGDRPHILLATLGDSAGMMGAAGFAWQADSECVIPSH